MNLDELLQHEVVISPECMPAFIEALTNLSDRELNVRIMQFTQHENTILAKAYTELFYDEALEPLLDRVMTVAHNADREAKIIASEIDPEWGVYECHIELTVVAQKFLNLLNRCGYPYKPNYAKFCEYIPEVFRKTMLDMKFSTAEKVIRPGVCL